MFKKNNFFFKRFKKFRKKKALILENHKIVSYEELLDYCKKIQNKLADKKELIFLLGQNNLETIIGYISFVEKGYAIKFIDYRINQKFLKKLIYIYKPSYIYCEKNKFVRNLSYKILYQFKKYILLEKEKKIKHNINKNLMLLVSTSGTTGSAKFVRQSYKNIADNTKNIIKYLNIKNNDITITSLPISYVYGLSVINTHLFSGSCLVLTNKSMVERDFWKLISVFKVNNFAGVPYNYSIIEKIFKKKIPESIKYTTQAGGKMNETILKKIIGIYKKNKIKLIQMYGAAEATSRMSFLPWMFAEKKIGSIGKPISGGHFQLIDSKKKIIKKNFVKGELIYKGNNVCMGYAKNLNDLSLPDQNKGILKTGDIAFRDNDNFYYIVGRKDRYVKIFGNRIDLSELESILSSKGMDVIMRDGGENKIFVYFKDKTNIFSAINYISKLTAINSKVFVCRTITKKNLTYNLKYKV